MNCRYKVSIVSYLNTIPFLYGIKETGMINKIQLEYDYPSKCAEKLINNNVDLALVPVVVIPKIKNSFIISDYCIGAEGPVESVCLFSNEPIHKIKCIHLDYQSRTSIELLKLLCRSYWKVNPQFLNLEFNNELSLFDYESILIIGDRAFDAKYRFKYSYDLSKVWSDYTALPFVFACWVANNKLSKDFINEFNKSLCLGVSNIRKSLCLIPEVKNKEIDTWHYLNNCISYSLDAKKKLGMNSFFSQINL